MTLLARIFGSRHQTEMKKTPFDSSFHGLFREVNYVCSQTDTTDLSSFIHSEIHFVYELKCTSIKLQIHDGFFPS